MVAEQLMPGEPPREIEAAMTNLRTAVLLTFTLGLMAHSVAGAERFVPSGDVDPDRVTVLMAVDTPLPEGCTEFQPGGHGKFYAEGWSRPEQTFRWTVTAPRADDYAVSVLARRLDGPPLDLLVHGPGHQVQHDTFTAEPGAWDRQLLPGTLRLATGENRIELRALSHAFNASLLSLELVRPEVREHLRERAELGRADTAWLRRAGFGIMCHWTSESCPRQGPRMPYAEAVRAFDARRFAQQIAATGAGFVVFTTSHSEMYVPAPIQALDRILPGRTTERDLIADLIRELQGHGIRLMLYYHLGAASDPEWLEACGFWETDTRTLFAHWEAVVGEVGRRYGSGLAGWWFDDGAVSTYYRSAPWERLTAAARLGNPARLVGYNPWELPAVTVFQDCFCGEGFADPGSNGRLIPGGDGRLTHGSHAGLQACATLAAEAYWVHNRPDTEIPPPHWSPAQLRQLLERFASYGNVPIFNLGIYQDATLSPPALTLFRDAASAH
jgi:hypothetical protein